jgi:hypothetical protein
MAEYPVTAAEPGPYERLLLSRDVARDRVCAGVPESLVQQVWLSGDWSGRTWATADGRPVRIVSPGWWNQGEGPDFHNAQVEIGGELKTGSVEIHLRHGDWHRHGHDQDPRYDDVVLEVVLEEGVPATPPRTAAGRGIPVLSLLPHVSIEDLRIEDGMTQEEDPRLIAHPGLCASVVEACGTGKAVPLLLLAGEWRALSKARAFQEEADRRGAEQALYERVLAACGYSRYKAAFAAIARALPWERARQLARRDPLLLEAALMHLAGLLPEDDGLLAESPHLTRLVALRREELPGLRRLPLEWKRAGVRPLNAPERRLAGAALLAGRHADKGLLAAAEVCWEGDVPATDRVKMLEGLFPKSMGHWSRNCGWKEKPMARPASLFGESRKLGIIGNVLVPQALARARARRDRGLEERVWAVYGALPADGGNRLTKAMLPRFFGDREPPRMDFRMQQGLLQLYFDWCETNPACLDCPVAPALEQGLAWGGPHGASATE